MLILLWASGAPAQNRCYSATPIGNGLTAGSNIGATSGGSDSVGSCGSMGSDVWYSYLAPCTGNAAASFCAPGAGANFDTVLAAWDGSCGCAALAQLSCNDDFCGTRSQVVFTVAAGQLYYISVGGFAGAQGTFTLSMACTPGAPPTNDECIGAIQLPQNGKVVGTNVGATNGASLANCGNMHNDVWYVVNFLPVGYWSFSTCNPITTFDTVIALWSSTGTCGPSNPTWIQGTCNDDSCALAGHGLNSTIGFNTFGGGPLYISVGGYGTATGTFALSLTQVGSISVTFFDAGPGTIGYRTSGDGYYYVFVSLVAGAFPIAWFFGIDITIADIVAEANAGYPFSGPQTICGVVGPFGGLPSGLAVYAVALRTTAPGGSVTGVSQPVTFTVP